MQYTSNYNLNLPEGTDIVNPLTIDNPNYSAIDAAMFANKQAVIGTATETVSGTFHAIVRANTDAPVFRFTATGNWTAGDTMSVDGVGVSVYMPDGTAPATGCYVINSEVIGILAGSRVTLYAASAVDPSAIEAAVIASLEPRLVATSAANQTYGAQLTELNVHFQQLTAAEKARSYIKFHGGYYARFSCDLYNLYTGFEITPNLLNAYQISPANGVFRSGSIDAATNDFVIYNGTNEIDSSPLELWVGIQ